MKILGMYPAPFDQQYRHDSNVCIIADGEIYAYEEAKLRGTKNDEALQFPLRSMLLGMKELNIDPTDVDFWVFPKPAITDLRSGLKFLFCDLLKVISEEALDDFILEKVKFIPHHLAHIYMAGYASPFLNSKILSLDGGGDKGDNRHAVWGSISKSHTSPINFLEQGESLGYRGLSSFHLQITDAIGFGDNNGKTSGLAAYGINQPELYEKFSKIIYLDSNDQIVFNSIRSPSKTQFKKIRCDVFEVSKYINCSPAMSNVLQASIGYRQEDIAATGESIIKNLLIQMINKIFPKQKGENLVCVGGLFNNVSINQHLIEATKFENYYFSMAPGDAGLSLGLASSCIQDGGLMLGYHDPRYGMSPYLGPSYSDSFIEKIISESSCKFHKFNSYEDINSQIASLLMRGEIIGLFRGRGEFGPRSLGNRSILASPILKESKARINLLAKRRDWFMPFAPAVIEEYFDQYFNMSLRSAYMQLTPFANQIFRAIAPSAVHIDGSCRAQTVTSKLNPEFHDLIKKFGENSGCYAVLNTSFNRHGIATISHPKQAIEHLLDGVIDTLILNNYLIRFDENRIESRNVVSSFEVSEKELLDEENYFYKEKVEQLIKGRT